MTRERDDTARDLERMLQPAIDEERIASNWQRVAHARRPAERVRRPMRWAVAFAVAAAVAAAVYVASSSRGGPLTAVDVAIAPGSVLDAPAHRVVALDDGSALDLAGGARLQVLTNESDRFVMLLMSGRARFDVHPGGARRWEIETSRATVEVVGTAFTVESDDRRVVVEVEHGVVMVRGERVPGRVARLVAGDRLEIDDARTAEAARTGGDDDRSTSAGNTPTRERDVSASPATGPSDTHDQDVGSAIGSTTDARGSATATDRTKGSTKRHDATGSPTDRTRSTSVNERTGSAGATTERATAADATRQHATSDSQKLAAILGDVDQRRMVGDAAGAAELLEAALAKTRDDPSLGLAEFTLGRLYLEDLGAPDRAAAAFAKMIALGSPHALLEDAYARRIEALVRAERTDDARAALADYDHLYPHGLRRAALHALLP